MKSPTPFLSCLHFKALIDSACVYYMQPNPAEAIVRVPIEAGKSFHTSIHFLYSELVQVLLYSLLGKFVVHVFKQGLLHNALVPNANSAKWMRVFFPPLFCWGRGTTCEMFHVQACLGSELNFLPGLY